MNQTSPPRPSSRRPPTFREATSLRHKAWSAGFDPAYWYAVALASDVPVGAVIHVRFQGTDVALFRGADGVLGAVEDRCAHRQVKLSDGFVRDCQVVCRYHGWTFDRAGSLVGIADDLAGRSVLRVKVRSYPVAEKYGLVFVFFGDPALAAERSLPVIPELDGDDPWFFVPITYTMKCHPTSYINNVMDSTHVATLHTKLNTRSMLYGGVTFCETRGDHVVIGHDVRLDPRGILPYIVGAFEHGRQEAHYEYPYLHVHVGGISMLWNFMLPQDEGSTKLFLLSCAKNVRLPLLGRPRGRVAKVIEHIAREVLVRPLFDEDVWSTEAEQAGYAEHFDQPEIDPHPSIRPCYELTARKWAEHLARTDGPAA